MRSAALLTFTVLALHVIFATAAHADVTFCGQSLPANTKQVECLDTDLMLLFAVILGGLQVPWFALVLVIVAPSVSALLLLALSIAQARPGPREAIPSSNTRAGRNFVSGSGGCIGTCRRLASGSAVSSGSRQRVPRLKSRNITNPKNTQP